LRRYYRYVAGWRGPDGESPGTDTAGRHAVPAAEAIADWLSGRGDGGEAFTRYYGDRDEHVLADWTECTSVARDLSQLARP